MKNVQLMVQNAENVMNGTTGLSYAGGMRRKKRLDIVIPHQKAKYKAKYTQRRYYKNIRAVDYDAYNSDSEELKLHTVNSSDNRNELKSKIKIMIPRQSKKAAKIMVKVDTGAEGNILPQ